MKILVTGSSGTIGTRLCEKLIENGFNVTGIDKKPNRWNEKVNEITITGNLQDKKFTEKLPRDFDMVIHLAANARVYNLCINPEMAKENIETTFNILEFCRKNNIRKFIFASSREIYGNTKRTVHKENDINLNSCESPYAATKLAGEALVQSYKKCYGTNFVIIRFSNVYGMYDESDRVIPLFIRQTKENNNLIVFGKEKTLDFTYIDDSVSGILLCIQKFEYAKNNTFNIASGNAVKILDAAGLIKKMMKGKNKIIIKENRTGEVLKCVVDITKAKQILGYKPKTDFAIGIKKSIHWYLKNLY